MCTIYNRKSVRLRIRAIKYLRVFSCLHKQLRILKKLIRYLMYEKTYAPRLRFKFLLSWIRKIQYVAS